MRSVGVDSTAFAYVSTELYALAEAKNYYRWVISHFAPLLGKRVIEVGGGYRDIFADLTDIYGSFRTDPG